MSRSSLRAIDRLLRKTERPVRRRRGGFPIAPVYLAMGLAAGYQLVARLLPAVWGEVLPGGLDSAERLRGWPGLLWRAAVYSRFRFNDVLIFMVGAVAASFAISLVLRPLRFVVWLAAAAVILLDFGVMYVMLRTCVEATAAGPRM